MAGTYRLKRDKPAPEKPSASARVPAVAAKPRTERLVSLDAYRGFIMIVLAAHGFGFSHFAELPADAPAWNIADYDIWQTIGFHSRHAKWIAVNETFGVAFWDLIQPSFMFMVGVAMPFSFTRRTAFGESGVRRFLHALIRAVVLVLMGVFLYSLGDHPRTNWIFPNVLAQIGLGYFFVYLLLNCPRAIQLSALVAIIVGYWALFYCNPPPEKYDYEAFNASVEDGNVFTDHMAPWSKNANVAFRFDQWLLPQLRTPTTAPTDAANEVAAAADEVVPNEVDESANSEAQDPPPENSLLRQWFFSNPNEYSFNRSGYTTLNFIPSIATALLGVLCGQLLISRLRPGRILLTLLISGAICIGLGLAAQTTVCPIIKIIWTPSWVLFSGGCVIWMLALFYFLFDVLPFSKLAWPLQVIGINSLAVYLMGELLPRWVGDNVITTHCSGFLETVFGMDALSDDMFGRIIGPTAVAVVFWMITVYMYRRRIFVRV
jgi:heparan-alpha-glucosaminide N-acetyltransferase